MVAVDQDELLHLVRHSLDPALTVPCEKGLRIALHSTYRAQSLVLQLLDLATRQRIALEDAGLDAAEEPQDSDRYIRTRLEFWLRLRDDELD
jgi:hypothetical protein